MSVTIKSITKKSPADSAGILAGDMILKINGNAINDVLDYRFYMMDKLLSVNISRDGEEKTLEIKKSEYADLGLEFETYLMDSQRRCKNNCIFCFIDQLPKGLRESLYFKDDDSRLSFLFGNYITLTNLTDNEVERIIKMHISPINVSVHTTNPELRIKMMNNRFAGESLSFLYRFAKAGIKLNCQMVLCPGYNDGEELGKTIDDLGKLYPSVQSIAAVPVGLTKHREGLTHISPFNKKTAAAVVEIMEKKGSEFIAKYGTRLCYPADEFYLKSEREVPNTDFYEEFLQLENGVGMYSLMREEFSEAAEEEEPSDAKTSCAIATGVAAAPLIQELVNNVKQKRKNLDCKVYAIKNQLFGEMITVAGLVTGGDIISQLKSQPKIDKLLIPSSMLRREGDLFLDNTSAEDIEKALSTKVEVVDCNGAGLLKAITE